ncbi:MULTISPECIES: type A chloramphenicol O-acetyltransferase [Clostridium]|uniref:type A chloramphenicol O-acetyltransferase n=1 Tax=Clostridium TaxID=1485 RepID=UPI0006B2853D|nr:MULTISPECIES: type A chloramphenicol O-acetyltransferase [Clostridium]KOY66882.1 chloramphenicol acetyltransferase [Clostridium sporogenes]MBW5456590.1 type A chloramphenicol O-acetyltransferase [Clostridium sporogenes]MDU7253274.1 type A chloramphenicol O-acetyltransferase [Clostridium sp.]NFQ01223.1 type A chloramphenicol O-acetyltransferase [Clostridium sporogenes]NFQ41796.1 type A chloramphenicol O-acetyltransferase [Clostridium sporogenes]
MKFNLIDKENWSRKPYFDYYMNNIKCTYSMTADIEITDLLMQVKRNNIKLYPILIYMTSKIVNNHEELRTSFDEEGNLGYWESMSPSFTIFHKDDESFSNIWTEYSDDFKTFYNNCLKDIGKYSNVKKLFAKENQPKNTFPVSCVPWFSFTGANLNVYSDGKYPYLLPIITYGKYFAQRAKSVIPISLQMHHAVCDGYHATRFLNELQAMAYNFKEWLIIK